MHHTVTTGEHRHKLRAFIEVDRTSMSSGRLAVKLIGTHASTSTKPSP